MDETFLGPSSLRPDPESTDLPVEAGFAEVFKQLLSTLELDPLLQAILDVALRQTGIERGILFYFDPDDGGSKPWAVRGISGSEVATAENYSRTVIEEARAHRQVVVSDTRSDPTVGGVESIQTAGIRSVLCVPIADEERILGALYLDGRQPTAVRPGAARFVQTIAELSASVIANAERYRSIQKQRDRLRAELQTYTQFDEIIGRSRPMVELLARLERVAATDFPILILGESGSGKELLARAIHRASRRSGGPFVAQNCATVPGELLESELFGHERGAFTGAHHAREGLFRHAHGGTLFLDEIADLDLRLQAKLLRVLEDGWIRPVGSEQSISVDVRIVSATSADVIESVEQQRMRRDLYYRLNVMNLQVPPLRDRPEDIPLLLAHFVHKHRRQTNGREVRFPPPVVSFLQSRPWVGNVRELEHFVSRALVLVRTEEVSLSEAEALLDPMARASESSLPVGKMTLAEIETQVIAEAMRRTGGNKSRAASLLGIDRNALQRRLRRSPRDSDRD